MYMNNSNHGVKFLPLACRCPVIVRTVSSTMTGKNNFRKNCALSLMEINRRKLSVVVHKEILVFKYHVE